ncbi:MAG: putative 2-dehydropantoate 2-reductase [Desulfuromonas sp.]|nr:putative 2-dehydropantoate 2-reductase [Desulfuromonas sp.]
MSIAIIGAGALGLYYGAMLQRSGQQLHYLLRRDLQAIKENGLHITSPAGNFHLRQVNGYADVTEMPKVDLVIVGLKTFANDQLEPLIRPLLHDSTAILTLQNGLGNEERLAELFGAERILGGVAFLCSNRGEPGFVHHLSQGMIRLGEFNGGLSPRSERIATLFNRAGVDCEAIADLKKTRWEKLVWNIPFNGLCALTDHTTDLLLNHPPTRQLVQTLMNEVVAGANAQGLSSPIDAAKFSAQLIQMTEPMNDYRPSMMIDRQQGRPLELDAIYAIPLDHAAQHGVNMPQISMLFSLLSLGELDKGA